MLKHKQKKLYSVLNYLSFENIYLKNNAMMTVVSLQKEPQEY